MALKFSDLRASRPLSPETFLILISNEKAERAAKAQKRAV
jgi:hypothetical protein